MHAIISLFSRPVAQIKPFKDSVNDSVTSGCVEPERFGTGRSGTREEFTAQQFMGAMEADLHVRVSERKNLSSFRRAHLLYIAQDNNCAVSERKG